MKILNIKIDDESPSWISDGERLPTLILTVKNWFGRKREIKVVPSNYTITTPLGIKIRLYTDIGYNRLDILDCLKINDFLDSNVNIKEVSETK